MVFAARLARLQRDARANVQRVKAEKSRGGLRALAEHLAAPWQCLLCAKPQPKGRESRRSRLEARTLRATPRRFTRVSSRTRVHAPAEDRPAQRQSIDLDWATVSEARILDALQTAISSGQETAFAASLSSPAALAHVSQATMSAILIQSIHKNSVEVLQTLLAKKIFDPGPIAVEAMHVAAAKTRFHAIRVLLRDPRVRSAIGTPLRAPVLARHAFDIVRRRCCLIVRSCIRDAHAMRKASRAPDDTLARIIAMAYGPRAIATAWEPDYQMERTVSLMLDLFALASPRPAPAC